VTDGPSPSARRALPDHFSAVAARYAEARPSYPVALAQWLASLTPGHRQAWDCGTGSGQAAVLLATGFDRVVATDPSSKQLQHAEAHPRVEYRLGRESESGLPDSSCDLATASQAAHWFDLPAFYKEVDRVLAPLGILAVWGYARMHIGEAIDPIVSWFEHERVGSYWPPGRELTTSQYRTLAFPYSKLDAPVFVMERHWTSSNFLAYVATWSAVQRCRETEGRDPVPEIAARLVPLWGDDARDVRWPLHMLVGRKEVAS
jgi:ubiquinone/menaquinone biosynthesis C-methylase UbiE